MESVGASIRYLNPEWRGREARPLITSRDTRRANTRFYDVRIENARPLHERGELALDKNGFVLLQHQPAVRDFGDDTKVAAT